MSIPLTINGVTFLYPQTGNANWGAATTAWATAVTTGMLSKAGGTFTLTEEVDFGASFGLKSIVYKSRSNNISQLGLLRMNNSDLVTWRNGANTDDNTLGVNSSNELLYNGLPVGASFLVGDTPTINLDFADNELTADIVDNSITNSLINTDADIAVSKLAPGTSAQVLITNTDPTWTTITGAVALDATGVATITVPVSNEDHIILTDTNEVGFKKSRRKHFFFEEFDYSQNTDLATFAELHFGNTSWFSGYQNSTGGFLETLVGEDGHPGIIRLVTDVTTDASVYITRGFVSEGGNFLPYYVANVDEMNYILRMPLDTSQATLMFGLADSNLRLFAEGKVTFEWVAPISEDGYMYAVCQDGTDFNTTEQLDFTMDNDFHVYTIKQDPIGTFKFYIDDVLKATINTTVPSAESLGIYIAVETLVESDKQIEIDYVDFASKDLGTRHA